MIRLSSRAERWLLDHIAHLADESPSAARKMLADFRQLRLNLTAFPHMAPRGVIPGTRRAVLGSGPDVDITKQAPPAIRINHQYPPLGRA